MLRGIIPSNGGGGDISALTARVTTLENVQNEYEVFTSIASGTSSTITFPTGSTLVTGEYAGQNAIVTLLDANGRPIDQAAKTAAGAVITATLTSGGSYTLSGTPSAYPVGLVYQLQCSSKDASNIPLASIINATQIQGTMAKQNADAVAITGGTASLSSITLSGGTANGVLYLNSSKVATSVNAITFDGTTLSNVGAGDRAKFGTGTRNIFIAGDTGGVSLFDGAGQTGNGVYINGASNFVAGYIGSSEQMRLNGTGLGIGTTAPAAKLHISGDIQQENANYLKGKLSAGTTTRLFGLNALDTLYIGSVDANHTGGTVFIKGGATQMALDANGNVGIGTTSPSAKLEVASATTPTIRVTNSKDWATAETGTVGAVEFFTTDASTPGARVLSYVNCVNNVGSTVPEGQLHFGTALGGASGGAATTKMVLNADGNLGVGSSAPTTRLHLLKAVTSTGLGNGGMVTIENSDGGSFDQRAEIHFKNVGQVTGAISSSYTGFNAGQYAGALVFATKGTSDASIVERARIDSSGNLGIGTVSPTGGRLHVTQASGSAIFGTTAGGTGYGGNFENTDGGTTRFFRAAGAGANGVFSAGVGATTQLFLDASGNLGINTSSPSQKLEVAGVIKSSSGGFMFPDGTTQTTAATGGGGGGVTVKTTTVSVASAAFYQYTVTVIDAAVTASSNLSAWLVPNSDWDVDDLIGYDVSLTPQGASFDVCISAPGPIVGDFTIKYFIA